MLGNNDRLAARVAAVEDHVDDLGLHVNADQAKQAGVYVNPDSMPLYGQE